MDNSLEVCDFGIDGSLAKVDTIEGINKIVNQKTTYTFTDTIRSSVNIMQQNETETDKVVDENITFKLEYDDNSIYQSNIPEDLVENDIITQDDIPENEKQYKEPIDPVTNTIPSLIFIVPYRDRTVELEFFKENMPYILEDYPKDSYAIYYIHQRDNRVFNRGAMKNIGFIMVKNKYPNDYKNITLIFNDVDTVPSKKNLFDYNTRHGIVKHFFGFTYTLGGIVSIKAGDFEKINGFPNYWAWGYEDNVLQNRVYRHEMAIDRSIFFKIGDENIIQKNNTITRDINQKEYERFLKRTNEGIHSIRNIHYTIDESSGFVNVNWFNTEYNPSNQHNKQYDIRNGSKPYDTKFGLMYNNRRVRGGGMSLF
jgi:hypothetical protein